MIVSYADVQIFAQMKGAECVVLAGDPKQLAPFVQSEEAKRLGFRISLFERMQARQTALHHDG